ncbi:MAG: DUF4136 domain-containing protein [Kiritimatiellales bacterium]|nr:DUF4136 domain-containing protein [Kiritimatiellales bacterium]
MKKVLMLAVSAGLFSGCSSVFVSRDYDTSKDFSTLKTFAWQHAEQPQTGDPQIDNDLNDQRIRTAVETVLTAKGFSPADRNDADFLVAYFVDYKRKLNASPVVFGFGAGGGGRYGGVGYNTGITEYEEGNLTIDILEPTDGKMIWRGVGAQVAYEGSNPKKATDIINDTVEQILKKFPPQK